MPAVALARLRCTFGANGSELVIQSGFGAGGVIFAVVLAAGRTQAGEALSSTIYLNANLIHGTSGPSRSGMSLRLEGERIKAVAPDADSVSNDVRVTTQFRKVYRLLAGRGHKSRRIEKIFGTTFARTAKDIWGARAQTYARNKSGARS